MTGSLQPRHLGSSPFSFPAPCSTQGLPCRPHPFKVSQSIFPLRIRWTLTAPRFPLLGRTQLLTAFPVFNASPGTSQGRTRSHHFHPPGARLGGMGLGRSHSGKGSAPGVPVRTDTVTDGDKVSPAHKLENGEMSAALPFLVFSSLFRKLQSIECSFVLKSFENSQK